MTNCAAWYQNNKFIGDDTKTDRRSPNCYYYYYY